VPRHANEEATSPSRYQFLISRSLRSDASFEDLRYCSVEFPGQAIQRVLDVYFASELTRPSTRGQLAGGVGRLAGGDGVDRYLFVSGV
jgi:hypothetical protein